jgi:hypothetical protein
MARSGKRRWSAGTLAVPLLLSLAIHGVLLGVLWLWPARSPGPALSIESARISLDTCLLDGGPAAAQREKELPDYLRGPNIGTEIQPHLLEAPVAVPDAPAAAGPTLTAVEPAPVRMAPGRPAGGGTGTEGNGVTGSLFPLPVTAASVVYVLDRSVSMGMDDKLDIACRELIAGLRRLPPTARFQIVAYNRCAEPLVIDGRIDLLPAEPALIEKAALQVEQLSASGESDHVRALCRALALHPDVLFFVTDADALTIQQVAQITNRNASTIIHAIEMTRRRGLDRDGPLARLAHDNRGTYRRVSPHYSVLGN